MIQPIYQTMTGEIQCVMHDGALMVREWPEEIQHNGPNPFEWTPCRQTTAQIELERKDAAKKQDRRRLFRAGCKLHCLEGVRPSGWYSEPKSLALAREIESLMAKRDEAIASEIADRPEEAHA